MASLFPCAPFCRLPGGIHLTEHRSCQHPQGSARGECGFSSEPFLDVPLLSPTVSSKDAQGGCGEVAQLGTQECCSRTRASDGFLFCKDMAC